MQTNPIGAPPFKPLDDNYSGPVVREHREERKSAIAARLRRAKERNW